MWVFGIVQRNPLGTGIGYLEVIEHRNAETLLPIIKKVVLPGTKVYSDEWKAYHKIQQELHLEHETVCHKLHFIDPVTRVHTNTVESYWNKCKSVIKTMHGCRRNLLQSYLNEFMWRDRFGDDPFNYLCKHISEQYPF